ncbi:hypothetical protein Hanom_Chr17g01543081 [Helianthus anomalus]
MRITSYLSRVVLVPRLCLLWEVEVNKMQYFMSRSNGLVMDEDGW